MNPKVGDKLVCVAPKYFSKIGKTYEITDIVNPTMSSKSFHTSYELDKCFYILQNDIDCGHFKLVVPQPLQNGIPIPSGSNNNSGKWKFNIGDTIICTFTKSFYDVIYINQIHEEYELQGSNTLSCYKKDLVEYLCVFYSNAMNSPAPTVVNPLSSINVSYSPQTVPGGTPIYDPYEISIRDPNNLLKQECTHDWRDSRSEGSTKWCVKCGDRK